MRIQMPIGSQSLWVSPDDKWLYVGDFNRPLLHVVDCEGEEIVKTIQLKAVPGWPYAELGRAWGGLGVVARTRAALRAALAQAAADTRFAIVEAITPPDDLSPVTRRYMGTGS